MTNVVEGGPGVSWRRGYWLFVAIAFCGCAGFNRYPDFGRTRTAVVEGRVVSVEDAGVWPLMWERPSAAGTVHPYDRARVVVTYIDENRSGWAIGVLDTITVYCLTSASGYSASMDKVYIISPVFAERLTVGRAGVFGLDAVEGRWVVESLEDKQALRSREYLLRK